MVQKMHEKKFDLRKYNCAAVENAADSSTSYNSITRSFLHRAHGMRPVQISLILLSPLFRFNTGRTAFLRLGHKCR